MPHLSPMNWPLSFLIFWLLLAFTITSFWWLQTPHFPPALLPKRLHPTKPWHWPS